MLKISDLEMLDYADSGMMGWPSNDAPGSFWRTPVEEGAARLAELMRHYRPDVVVTTTRTASTAIPTTFRPTASRWRRWR